MKTPLPEKILPPTMTVTGSDLVTVCPLNQEAVVINQLIDYLAELTAVVEGKQDKMHIVFGGTGEGSFQTAATPGGTGGDGMVGSPLYTPTLKEQLLGEIKETSVLSFGIRIIAVEDVEAIINRVMP